LNADPKVPPNFVTADFLIARAIIETGIAQAVFAAPFCTGPFRLLQNEWDSFLRSNLKVAELFKAADVIYPMVQVYAAGHAMHAAGKAFAAQWIAANPQDQEFVPSYLDLFHTYLTDAPTAVAIRVNESAAPPKRLSELVNETALATITSRKSLGQIKGSMTIREFVAETEALLTSALNAAFEKIKTLAADELPKVTAGATGSAPWFDEAHKQLDDHIDESSERGRERIKTYFDATDHGSVVGELPPWCGAFAAFCMKSSVSPVPKGSALAASWKSWGSRSLPVGSNDIPVGAVVVLTPSEGTRGSGHVGFFSKFSPDGKKIELLGGNQSDTVKFSQFPITRVAAIRVLENTTTATSGAATNHFNLTAAKVPKERHKWGDLIVDRFQRAGFTNDHHLRTALANAIAESGLDPTIKAAGTEESYGLFQCNRRGGLGIGFTVEELKDADTNISIILKAARASKAFCSASSLAAAMDAFVRHIERPADPDAALSKRMGIANLL
jgi:uncharacterized protein (TIGR02594 family)